MSDGNGKSAERRASKGALAAVQAAGSNLVQVMREVGEHDLAVYEAEERLDRAVEARGRMRQAARRAQDSHVAAVRAAMIDAGIDPNAPGVKWNLDLQSGTFRPMPTGEVAGPEKTTEDATDQPKREGDATC